MTEPLIHVGYHKTGSTWLQKSVFSAPELGFLQVPARKMIDEEFVILNPFAFDPKQAASRFESLLTEATERGLVPVLSHERLSGKHGTGGIDSQPIADRLAAAFPNAKVLIVIREQRDMMMSVYRAHLMRFGYKKIRQVWKPRTRRERRTPGRSLDYYEYHYLIRYYQQLFGRDRVLVLPFERLKEGATGFVAEISRFVGTPEPAEVPSARINPGLQPAALAILRVINRVMWFFGFASVFKGPIGDSRARRARLKIVRKGARFVPKRFSGPVDRRWKEQIDAIVGDTFAKSNRTTADLTGIDLARYGYPVDHGSSEER